MSLMAGAACRRSRQWASGLITATSGRALTDHRDDELRLGIEQLELDRHGIALEHFTTAADGAATAEERCAAMAFATQCCLTLDRAYEAIAWAERLRMERPAPDEANLLEASAWVRLGDGGQALELLEAGVADADSPYMTYPPALVHQLRCQAHGLTDDPDAALREAFAALLTDWALPEIWRALATMGSRHDVDVSEAVGRIPDEGVLQVLGWLVEAPARGVDHIVEALWQRRPGDQRVLALVTTLGNRLPLERAMEWSARLRAAGLGRDCAVLGIAASEDRPARERLRAAAIAAKAFGDERAIPVLEAATTVLSDEELVPAFVELLELAPDDVFDAFIVASATTVHRSLTLARELVRRGVADAALALARHAVNAAADEPELLRATVESTLDAESLRRLTPALRRAGLSDVAAG